ncbi:MAG: DNA topoisomerase 4 subunit A [Bacteroidota bacterium]|nr:DNA topoisomerase 4 subunit A [Bacteroidota bacterium]MDE2957227.1 DNA topoisomerase 4 subunit A [Bacteroidota bacterium]
METAPFHEATRSRFLTYAVSVITGRAIPDIRDGLKPVHRRILYAMYTNLRLYPDARYRKSATIVGETMGKYHPHGDGAIYDAMARMAQYFSLRDPLVEGHGNFGSIDGDRPAAMRYTEARLQPLAMELLEEIRQSTVAYRPNFDGSLSEPVVLPASFPNLLVNGTEGIAVGMTSDIPPHNLDEVVAGAIYLVDSRIRSKHRKWPANAVRRLVQRHIRGPDFPLGGTILATEDDLVSLYETGEGALTVRGEYKQESKRLLVITSLPYGVRKSRLVERIADRIARNKLPQVFDIRDESTDEIRVVLELTHKSSARKVLAYLFKRTELEKRIHVRMTCLIPTDDPQISVPRKVSLQQALEHFLEFRLEVVTRRLRHELEQLRRRIHILEGFEIIFDALDEAIKIIRSSRNRTDGAQRLRHRFQLSEDQSNAILDARLYKLSQMEIMAVREELAAKRVRAAEIEQLLEDTDARWKIVRTELREVRKKYGTPRRTSVEPPDGSRFEYTEEDFIPDETVTVIVTRSGRIKRQGSYSDISTIRVPEGDEVGWTLEISTRSTVVVWTSTGRAYTLRVHEIAVSPRGYGEPLQKYFSFVDKERVVGVIGCDKRILPRVRLEEDLFPKQGGKKTAIMGMVLACSRKGFAKRIVLNPYITPSRKGGRMYMKIAEDDSAVGAWPVTGREHLCLASQSGSGLVVAIGQLPELTGAARGVIAMRLSEGDYVLGAAVSSRATQGLRAVTNRGRERIIRPTLIKPTGRGDWGRELIKRGCFEEVRIDPVEIKIAQ